ncbi:MAG: glycerol-3-phosphate 1-O-acyltransferase [Gammaproteobacteria bacterium]|nr:MAG: glycerol-3-phosphate 1-O-acyltransferase [Gammaproteobacteria bacterium]
MLTEIILIVSAYCLGSVSSAIIVCQIMGLPDPRDQGSGNPGATNVLRIGGKKAAVIVLVGDLLKGLIPVLIGHLLHVPLMILGLAGLAAFLGHLYPVFFRFQGGKGVATFIGVILGIHWILGLAAVGTWLITFAVVKISSVSALVMAALVPVYSWLLYQDLNITAIIVAIVVMLYWRHRSNIRNLIHGEEGKIEVASRDSGSDSADGDG